METIMKTGGQQRKFVQRHLQELPHCTSKFFAKAQYSSEEIP